MAMRPQLRVAIDVADAPLRARLIALVAAAGYLPAADPGDADVVLSDSSDVVHDHVVSFAGGDAQGLLDAYASDAQIDAALRAVASGLTVRMTREPDGFSGLAETTPLLTPREIEILALIGEGLQNKVIARQLGISQHTVKFHVESLLRKLEARSRAEAVAKGIDLIRQSRVEI